MRGRRRFARSCSPAAVSSVARTVKDRLGVDMLVAPRRHVLDASARRCGRRRRRAPDDRCHRRRRPPPLRRAGHRRPRSSRRRPVELSARFVVGADGLGSRIARSVDAPFTEVRTAGSGATHYAYFAGEWPAMEYHLGDRLFAGVFPTNDGEACVWVCSPADEARRVRRRAPNDRRCLRRDGAARCAGVGRAPAQRRHPQVDDPGSHRAAQPPPPPGRARLGVGR